MSDIFRIHDGAQTVLKGWERSTHIAGSLINTIPDTLVGTAVLRKMGTSIPSPFARMFLFDAAFKMIQNNHNGNTSYHLLVSECLDLLEFLYLRSNDPALVVKKWDRLDELNHLRSSAVQAHRTVADTLENHLDAVLPSLKEIYLFFYNNVLIGGTSPLTMVFTSPNWQRKNSQQFTGGIAGQTLFSGSAFPLHTRSNDFRVYMQKLRLAYNVEMHQQAYSLFDYLQQSFNVYDHETRGLFGELGLAAGFTKIQFGNDYSNICMLDGTMVTSGFLPLSHKSMTVSDSFSSGYMIRPSHQAFVESIVNGVPVHLNTPLALTDAGLPNVTYLGGKPWDTHTCSLQRFPLQPLHERQLPGGAGIKYPYLMDVDFLQDTLIKVPYVIDSKKFVTCFDGETNYLLPLKQDYFRFFTVEDLKRNMKIVNNGNKVVVTLNIPIVDATYPYITFKKEYEGDAIIECNSSNKYFNVGFMPFYKVTDNTALNHYCIMLGDTTGQVGLNFYSFNAIDSPIITKAPCQRSNISKYIHIDSFDFIQLSYNGDKALIIPEMKEVVLEKASKSYLFCVDFGTTNTHISYSEDQGATSVPFTISENELQVAYLNKLNLSNGNSGDDYWNAFRSGPFAACTDREFVPSIIGGEKACVSYPYRTAVCETSLFKNGLPINLFGNISLGFLMLRELSKLHDNEYRTDLKWALENRVGNMTACENRVKAYCEQIIWMIKNKVLLNDGKISFKLILTFPGTMNVNTKNSYIGFWEDACRYLLPDVDIQIKEESESVVPYYSFVKSEIKTVADAVNVDIGGGTTDMLFIQSQEGRQYFTSSLFAANDLWGDGLSALAFAQKNNGYIGLINKALSDKTITISKQDLIRYYNTYKEIAQSSADIISFLFQYDEEFKLSNLIKNNNDLYALVFIHFAAIMYHISQIAKKIGMGIPTYLTFTGMGSNLIKLISKREDDIKDLAELLLETFYEGQSTPELFMVKFASNPKEITAEGGLASQHPDIQKISPNLIKVYGFDGAADDYEFGDAVKLKDEVISEFTKFVDVFTNSKSIRNFLFNKYGVKISDEVVKNLKKYSGLSYDMMANRKFDVNAPINETLFFWPLKQTLYELTKLELTKK